ncbi:MAG: hypothetical protein ACOYWZ_01370 [Bacillota bacterium]
MYIFSFDAESDGLYGDIFAIGAAVIDSNGNIIDTFSGAAEIEAVSDQWTIQNVVGKLDSLPIFNSRRELRDAFWSFWMKYREKSTALCDNGIPVEAFLFRQCVGDNLEERKFLAPYPLLDVASLLHLKGIDNDTSRMSLSGYNGNPHNPLDDAIASALCWVKLLSY